MKSLALVVPCYNEQDVLPLFYNEIVKVISGLSDRYSVELVFVDDGSGDKTLQIVKGFADLDPSVKYISFSRNFGKEAAMLAGMRYAVKADFIAVLDADLQHSPDLIPEMLSEVDGGEYDVAAARRSDREGESALTSFLSSRFYKFANSLCEIELSDSAQDFRVMRQEVVKAVLSMPENIRFSKGIFTWVGFRVKWIEHKNRERAAGQTKWSIRKLMKYALDGILGYTNSPLRFSFFCSAAFAIFALIALIYGLVRHLASPGYVCLLPPILAAVFFAACAVLFCLGVIGEYLGRTYTEVKNRPPYLIADTNTWNPPVI